jgi:cell shape-determining protein MreC
MIFISLFISFIKVSASEVKISNTAYSNLNQALNDASDNVLTTIDVNSDLNEFSYVIGKVKYRDLYKFNEEIVIDVRDVSKGDAVVNSEGLVGIVVSDKGNVKLLTSTYNVSVSIGECYGNLSNGSVDMVDKECNVREGDKVYTSGLGNVVKGIYVGSVSKVDNDSLGLVLSIDLIDNSNLNYVGVIK